MMLLSALLSAALLTSAPTGDADTIHCTHDFTAIALSAAPVPSLPAPLSDGDTLAIVAPAGECRGRNLSHAAAALNHQGWHAIEGPHIYECQGSLAGSVSDRLYDLRNAFLNPSVKAILCARGGYGAIHLLESLDSLPLSATNKWLVGFSDISALHAFQNSRSTASIHGPMAINFHHPDSLLSPSCKALIALLKGKQMHYSLPVDPLNRRGYAVAPLRGGNLSVISELASTPYDAMLPGSILLIEDVGEPAYKIQRMLYRLKLSGVLSQLKGLIVGEFTDAPADIDYPSIPDMIADLVKDYSFPVAYNVPIGHAAVNLPVVLGANASLRVDPDTGVEILTPLP